MYLKVTFDGIFTNACPLHRETTLKISAEVDDILLGVLRFNAMNMSTSPPQEFWRIIILNIT